MHFPACLLTPSCLPGRDTFALSQKRRRQRRKEREEKEEEREGREESGGGGRTAPRAPWLGIVKALPLLFLHTPSFLRKGGQKEGNKVENFLQKKEKEKHAGHGQGRKADMGSRCMVTAMYHVAHSFLRTRQDKRTKGRQTYTCNIVCKT